MKILETERTILREVTTDDCEFILNLLNQPSFIKFIGDRNLRTVEQARDYIESRFTHNYKQFGFGMYAADLKETNETIGICGFVKRDSLPEADIGFALLPQFERKGYAFESAAATLLYGIEKLNFKRVLAITSKDNFASGRLLEKLGFTFERFIKMTDDAEEIKLFSTAC
ncbi:MAG: GNAT family N-acetyltransferase [Acidobacteria bacterium]|nr:GNAT family N-acetyltransferase [Acidobacteriota bacterium]